LEVLSVCEVTPNAIKLDLDKLLSDGAMQGMSAIPFNSGFILCDDNDTIGETMTIRVFVFATLYVNQAWHMVPNVPHCLEHRIHPLLWYVRFCGEKNYVKGGHTNLLLVRISMMSW
jgi:hypothetical protein